MTIQPYQRLSIIFGSPVFTFEDCYTVLQEDGSHLESAECAQALAEISDQQGRSILSRAMDEHNIPLAMKLLKNRVTILSLSEKYARLRDALDRQLKTTGEATYGNTEQKSKYAIETFTNICENLLEVAVWDFQSTFSYREDLQDALAWKKRALAMRTHPLFEEVPPKMQSDLCFLLGVIYLESLKVEDALLWHQSALSIRHEIFEPSDPDLCDSYLEIGKCFYLLGKFELALEYHTKALEKSKEDLSPIHTQIGNCHLAMGNISEGLRFHIEAYSYRNKLYGEESLETADSLCNLGVCYRLLKKIDLAVEHQEKVLKIRKKILPKVHPDLATSYNNLAVSLKQQGEHGRAIENFQVALKHYLSTYGELHRNAAITLTNMGTCFLAMGEKELAKDAYERSLSIRKHIYPKNHPSLLLTMEDIRISKWNPSKGGVGK